ncbi:UNVERIFIED_CONTAM: hypothetical protein FKN15_037301 [Acipenser sinensis]
MRTDHQALTALLSTSGSGHKPLRLLRWADRLNQYNYTLEFTPGRQNTVADLLSRAVVPPSTVQQVTDTEPDLVQLLQAPLSAVVSMELLRKGSQDDALFTTLRTYIRGGWPSSVAGELLPYYRVRAELSCWEDVCIARGHRTLIPAALRAQVLRMAHEGHLGVVKLKQRCRDIVWWPNIDQDIELMVKDCTACLLSGKASPPTPVPLSPVQWPSAPWKHLQVDLCGELHGAPAHARYLLVVHDLHSKWPEALPMGSVTTQAVIQRLDSLFARWGLPDIITTDNGPQFISTDFTTYLAEKAIKHIRTAVYHPQSNGGVERLNQTLKNGIRAYLTEGWQFEAALLQTLLHCRASKHTTTGVSPALLMLGRELQLPLDRLSFAKSNPAPSVTRLHVEAQQQRMKLRFDQSRRAKPPTLQELDWVRVWLPRRHSKLQPRWSEPSQIIKKLGPATYCLQDGSRWHADRLRKVPVPTEAQGGGSTPSLLSWQPPAVIDNGPAAPPAPLRAPQVVRRLQRAKQQPSWMKDYVTG